MKNITVNLFVYGIIHGVVDCICAGIIFSIYKFEIVSSEILVALIILYNILAFGLQAVFGLLTDYFKSPRTAAISGCILIGLGAMIFTSFPITALILAGIGNALFHVGGGIISLNLTPKKASAPGIFVAPGALGLVIGILAGKNGQFVAWQFTATLIILISLMLIIKIPKLNYDKKESEKIQLNNFELILLLVLFSIAIRSLVGSVIVFPWKSDIELLFVLTGAVVLGKALGGILADKFGWIKIAVGALVLSIPFLTFGANVPFLAVIGMFLFNITMPITLVAVSNTLPGKPGFAFGLTTLALIIGAIPSFLPIKHIFASSWIIFIIITISAVFLYLGLYRLKTHF